MPTPTDSPAPPSEFADQALDHVQEELLALDRRDLLPMNVDVDAAALIVLGAVSEIRPYRAALVRLCGEEMTAPIDRLALLARAALQAQGMHRAIEEGADIPVLSAQVAKFREGLLAEVRALIARDVLSPSVIRELRGGRGYKNQCIDVLQLVSALKAEWVAIAGETGLTVAYVDRAEAAAGALAAAVGVRDQASRSRTAALRQRAYTLMAKRYDQARRMLSFLRWEEGDLEEIAPSLYRGRGGKGRRRVSAAENDVTSEPAVVDGGTPGMPGGEPFANG